MDTKRVIELKGVSVYHGGNSKRDRLQSDLILKDVNLAINEGEFVYFIGRVGTGKSTLLKTLYGEVDLYEGDATVVGFDLRTIRRKQIPYLRRSIGIVFQDFQLLTDRNVFLNLYDVMRATGNRSEEDIRHRIDEVLTLVGLEHKAYKMPFELSGGEQQRLTIARALLNKPRLILADEPTGNLDRDTQKEIMEIFRELANQGKCVILVSHSPDVAEMCDEKYELIKISGRNKKK